jgi:hypothetical protein
MCPGVKSGENRIQALARQVNYYGHYRAHRLFFDTELMDSTQDEYDILINGDVRDDEDLWVSCKVVSSTSAFRSQTAELKEIRANATGKTLITIHHEPEGDLTVPAYNTKWDTAAPVLEEEYDWLMAGTIHTAFWSRKVDAAGVRAYDWRQWIPSTPSTRALLQFVGADLYPGAGRPTKAKPNYYEPPWPHPSPYGFGTEIGFCGILDEMCEELDLPGAIGEINHERPSTANGWPSSFTDPDGSGNVEWMKQIVSHAKAQKYLMVCQFHKGGGILTDRTPQAEAQYYKSVLQANWNDVDEEQPDPNHPQYAFGYAKGLEVGRAEGRDEGLAIGRQLERQEILDLIRARNN